MWVLSSYVICSLVHSWLRERIVHLLALKPQKRGDLVTRLKKGESLRTWRRGSLSLPTIEGGRDLLRMLINDCWGGRGHCATEGGMNFLLLYANDCWGGGGRGGEGKRGNLSLCY